MSHDDKTDSLSLSAHMQRPKERKERKVFDQERGKINLNSLVRRDGFRFFFFRMLIELYRSIKPSA